MICQNCQTGFQAAEAWTWDHSIYTPDKQPHLIHSTHRSLLESILHGCPICRSVWRHLVRSYKKKHLGADASLPNHDEVQAHLELIRRVAEAHSSSQETPTLCDATAALEISDARSEDKSDSEMPLIQQLWQNTTAVLDPSSISCPVVVSAGALGFGVRAIFPYASALVFFKIVPISSPDAHLGQLKGSMGGYGTKACTSANSQLWKLWMGLCLEQHGECNKTLREQSSFSPRRLIEINSDEKINPTTWRVREIGETEKCPYLTLSHCWGTLQHHHRLTGATLGRFLQNENPVSELPKTFQDAMSITLSMGFRYIWIDSLCIIQDDVDDWKDQSSVMGLIYKHGTCNIAATWARNGAEGCFSPRNPADIEPGPWKIEFVKGPKEKKKIFRVVRADYEDVVQDAPLNARGWVVQERCLSRRQLQFAKDEVYWECSRYIASERFPAGMPKDSDQNSAIQGLSLGKLRLNHPDKDDLRSAWAYLVEAYSGARLTFSTDKSIAISGLANEVRELQADRYLAGLWEKNLHRQLCWSFAWLQDEVPATQRFRGAGPYIAPTWSWMSIDFPVHYDQMYWAKSDSVLHLAQVLSASVRSSHPSGLHSFLDGSLRMRVIGFWCRGVVDTDGDFETTHILRQPGDPAKRSAAGFSALLQGREIDITWDEWAGPDEGTDDEYETSEDEGTSGDHTSSEDEAVGQGKGKIAVSQDEGTDNEYEISEDDPSSDEEELGDYDGWPTCTEYEAVSQGKGKGKIAVSQEERVNEDNGTGDNYSEPSAGGEDVVVSDDDEVRHDEGLSRKVGANEEGEICEDRVRLSPDPGEQNSGHTGLATAAVDMRRSDLLLGFVHLSNKEILGRELKGLVLAEKPGSRTEFVRLGVFEYRLKDRKGGGSKDDVIELFKSRFGWNGGKFEALKADLGDPRFADLVHTVTIV